MKLSNVKARCVALALVGGVLSACGTTTQQQAAVKPPAALGRVEAALEGDPPVFRVTLRQGDAAQVLVEEAPDPDSEGLAADVFEVEGSGGRVGFAQLYIEQGEDFFSRSIQAWAVDAGTGAILWSGRGSYSNTMGACESLEVPEPRVESGRLVIRTVKGDRKLDGEHPDCAQLQPLTTEDAASLQLPVWP